MVYYLSHPVNINIVIFIIIPEAGLGVAGPATGTNKGSECKNVGSRPPLITPPGTGHQQTFASNYQMTIIAECEDSHYLFLHCICSLWGVDQPLPRHCQPTLDGH